MQNVYSRAKDIEISFNSETQANLSQIAEYIADLGEKIKEQINVCFSKEDEDKGFYVDGAELDSYSDGLLTDVEYALSQIRDIF